MSNQESCYRRDREPRPSLPDLSHSPGVGPAVQPSARGTSTYTPLYPVQPRVTLSGPSLPREYQRCTPGSQGTLPDPPLTQHLDQCRRHQEPPGSGLDNPNGRYAHSRISVDPAPTSLRLDSCRPWTRVEDELLLRLNDEGWSWAYVAAQLEDRTSKVCAVRFDRLSTT